MNARKYRHATMKTHAAKKLLTLLLIVSMLIPLFGGFSSLRASAAEMNQRVFEGNGFEVVFQVTGQWPGGYQAEVTVTNTGEQTIGNWLLAFDFKDEIINLWNGIAEAHDDGKYRIRNAGWNQNIEPEESISFGMTVNAEEVSFPSAYEINSALGQAEEQSYNVKFNIAGNWGDGFSGGIEIKNCGPAKYGWFLEFDFDREITDIWNAKVVSHVGNHYVIKCEDWNQNIEL